MYRILPSVFVAFEVDVLVFEPSPETPNPDVTQSSALSVHATLNAIVFKNLYKTSDVNWLPCSVLKIARQPEKDSLK